MTRRGFLAGGASAVSLGAFCGCRVPGVPPRAGDAKGRSYSVPVLGDIHFDSPDTKRYHADYTHSTSKKRYRAHLAEHVRNSEMWKERMPRLVRASGACMRGDEAFALQMGDLVQGDCGNGATHARMLGDAFSFVKGAYGGRIPLVVVAGNHDIRGDIRGDGARATLEKWLPETAAKELGVPVGGTTFSFRHGPDAYIVVDFNEPRPNLALLKRLLAETEGARYTFVVSHGPAVPNCISRWFLLGEKKRDAARRELRSLLARRNAIALGGHTHKLELYDCALPEGRLTQFVFNSVWTKPEAAAMNVVGRGAAEYGRLDACMAELVSEYRPFVKDYLFATAAGHYRLDVSDSGVEVAFYAGDATAPSRTFRLR
ncbi:MAG: metallophosphoesterase [Kiritimatiellae bacterium]|nr:metallophosphoesterase [Kiritimatiellia bacterium]